MVNAQKVKVPMSVLTACQYFIPRLLFLNSTHAPQIHWGDMASALYDFPEHLSDISQAEFWEEWISRWIRQADHYQIMAELAETESGKRRFYRSAAACYHWGEFMYFANQNLKTHCRKSIKSCFLKSVDKNLLNMVTGEIHYKTVTIPYYFLLPNTVVNDQLLPCVILSNGLDSVTEVEIMSFAEFFLAQGFSVLLFDGPGQGVNLGIQALEIEFENVVMKLVELLKGLEQVDPNQLMFFGVSFGGYIALRVAQYLAEYFCAVVNYSGGPVLSPFNQLPRRLKDDFMYAFIQSDPNEMQKVFDQLQLDVNQPVRTKLLSIHGGSDDIFPISDLKSMIGHYGQHHELQIYMAEPHVCLNFVNENSVKIAEWLKSQLYTQRG